MGAFDAFAAVFVKFGAGAGQREAQGAQGGAGREGPRARSVGEHFGHDGGTAEGGGVVGWPVGHFVEQGRAVIAPVEVIMVGGLGRDAVVAELDICGRVGVAIGLGKDVADAAVALGIGQDFIAVAGIGAGEGRACAGEGHGVARDGDPVDIGGVARVVIGAVIGGGFVAALGLVGHHRVERAILQIGVERLPLALPVRERAGRDVGVVEIAIIDRLGRVVLGVVMGVIVMGMTVAVIRGFGAGERWGG